MALIHSPKIITNGLVFAYDMANTQKSWNGMPTTNLVSDGMSIYNTVSSDVSASLVTTGEFYKGATIYKLTLTPITSTGVGYLTAGNNPGIGVISNGGGGLASRYTGHAIFFRPTTPMHSVPLFTVYSNITGWGAGSLGLNRSVSMGDGWYRGEVIWYDTVTRSDGKFWAINPANVSLNAPITVYWAAPFKEDRNDSSFVSQYTYSSRSSTDAITDLMGNHTVTANSLTYASDGTFSFNGSANNITIANNTILDNQTVTVAAWIKTAALSQNGFIFEKGAVNTQYALFQEGANLVWRTVNSGSVPYDSLYATTASYLSTSLWAYVVGTYTTGSKNLYVNGVLASTNAASGTLAVNASGSKIGSYNSGSYFFNGTIGVVQVYNRALSASEVKQNFDAMRGRYGV